MKKIVLIISFLASVNAAFALERLGHLGIGASNQLINDIPALSLKLQKTRALALGGIFGVNTSDKRGGYGGGLKAYRILFEEPQLNFYSAIMGAMIKQKTASLDKSGFQIDLSMGSEFSFAGLESLGFSFEFGVSMNKLDEFVIQTIGNHFIKAAFHFYI